MTDIVAIGIMVYVFAMILLCGILLFDLPFAVVHTRPSTKTKYCKKCNRFYTDYSGGCMCVDTKEKV